MAGQAATRPRRTANNATFFKTFKIAPPPVVSRRVPITPAGSHEKKELTLDLFAIAALKEMTPRTEQDPRRNQCGENTAFFDFLRTTPTMIGFNFLDRSKLAGARGRW
jgi:hypothetical protein